MDSTKLHHPDTISLIVTTYGTDTLYTQACLESIRRWKMPHHELIVVVHDESPLLRAYLDACASDGLIDRLLYAVTAHGHIRGFNLALQFAHGDVVFNICNDIQIGPSLVDECAHALRADLQLGLIGWHWYNEGTFWNGDKIVDYQLRDEHKPLLTKVDESNIRSAAWFTGRAFEGLGGPKWLCLCNTAFFGVRREVLDRIGGGFSARYEHYWADDFLNYAVLDQGLNVSHFEKKFRGPRFFHETQYDHTDVEDRRRHDDTVTLEASSLTSAGLLGGGMTAEELQHLYLLARAIPDGSTVTNVGVWRGSSAIVLLDALRDKRIRFYFLDCFDLPDISAMSAQPPVSRAEFGKYVEPFVAPRHNVNVIRANTLNMDRFPPSDFVFVDAGHTAECVANDARLASKCLSSDGIALFHDYGTSSWPDVQPQVDAVFKVTEVHHSLGIVRRMIIERHAYEWPQGIGHRIAAKVESVATTS